MRRVEQEAPKRHARSAAPFARPRPLAGALFCGGGARPRGRYSGAAPPAAVDPGGPPLIGKATNRPSHQRNVAEDTMPVINRVADLQKEVTAWRRDFHENPEILYEVHRTAGIVADKLKEFGCDEVVPGIGRTGVVAVIKGKTAKSGKVIGIRADMDALPIEESNDVPHKSKVPGKMHACGHDGHTAVLLGAAKYLAETRNFDGTAVMIFQPAEEGGAGGDAMVRDGMMERFGVQEVYGLHNMPGIPVGQFATRHGPLLAATDQFD